MKLRATTCSLSRGPVTYFSNVDSFLYEQRNSYVDETQVMCRECITLQQGALRVECSSVSTDREMQGRPIHSNAFSCCTTEQWCSSRHTLPQQQARGTPTYTYCAFSYAHTVCSPTYADCEFLYEHRLCVRLRTPAVRSRTYTDCAFAHVHRLCVRVSTHTVRTRTFVVLIHILTPTGDRRTSNVPVHRLQGTYPHIS